MTNEEIRLNRYCKHCRNYDKGCDWLCRGMICNEADAYELALDEKDQQFKEYLEKKKDSLELDYHKDSYEGNSYKYYILKEIINELFGGE